MSVKFNNVHSYNNFRIGLMGVNCNDELAKRVSNVLIEAIRAIENEKVVSKI